MVDRYDNIAMARDGLERSLVQEAGDAEAGRKDHQREQLVVCAPGVGLGAGCDLERPKGAVLNTDGRKVRVVRGRQGRRHVLDVLGILADHGRETADHQGALAVVGAEGVDARVVDQFRRSDLHPILAGGLWELDFGGSSTGKRRAE